MAGETLGGAGAVQYFTRYQKPGSTWGAYQEKITGLKAVDGKIPEYILNDVVFDGVVLRGQPPKMVLLEAKDGYSFLANRTMGVGSPQVRKILEEANRQLGAARQAGATVEWHVSSEVGAMAIRKILQAEDLKISVLYTPR